MRISTSQIYQTGTRQLMDGQSNLHRLQIQLASGKKFQSAQENPVAAVQVMLNSQALAVNTQYADNQANASTQLALEEERLKSVVDSVQFIMEQVVTGGNASYSDSQREYIAQTLQSQSDFLLGMANSADANGYYLFSGYQGSTKPFQLMADGSVNYVGDDGQRKLQVGASYQIAVSDSGRDIFQNIRTGNGTFSLAASSGNTGTGVIGGGSVNDITAWTGHNYRVEFTSTTGYDIYDDTVDPTTPVSSGVYTAGTDITDIPGISFSVSGEPAAGDTFSVSPSSEQSVFATLQNLITALSTDIQNNPTAAAQMRNTINTEMVNLNRTLENVSTVQASIGMRRSEVSSLTNVSEALDLQYQTRISDLQDVDYAEVISAFLQQQTQLQAAQSSFAQMTSLNLFSYLG